MKEVVYKMQENIDRSREIDMIEAENMKKKFLRTNGNDKFGFWIEAIDLFKDFLQQAEGVSSRTGKSQKAIGIQPGRTGNGKQIDLATEVIFYDKLNDKPDPNIERLEKDRFFGRLASDFNIHYNSIDDLDPKIRIRDTYPNNSYATKWILVSFPELLKFTEKWDFDKILIEFARVTDDKKNNRLTIIISRYDNGQLVRSSSALVAGREKEEKEEEVVLGFYLDDNDLLP